MARRQNPTPSWVKAIQTRQRNARIQSLQNFADNPQQVPRGGINEGSPADKAVKKELARAASNARNGKPGWDPRYEQLFAYLWYHKKGAPASEVEAEENADYESDEE